MAECHGELLDLATEGSDLKLGIVDGGPGVVDVADVVPCRLVVSRALGVRAVGWPRSSCRWTREEGLERETAGVRVGRRQRQRTSLVDGLHPRVRLMVVRIVRHAGRHGVDTGTVVECKSGG